MRRTRIGVGPALAACALLGAAACGGGSSSTAVVLTITGAQAGVDRVTVHLAPQAPATMAYDATATSSGDTWTAEISPVADATYTPSATAFAGNVAVQHAQGAAFETSGTSQIALVLGEVRCAADADCSALYAACSSGTCDTSTHECTSAPRAENAACDDADACTTGDACHAGNCTGTPRDDDHDGAPAPQCAPAGTAADCDDTNAAIHPGAPEICNGRDDDCDGATDNACASLRVTGARFAVTAAAAPPRLTGARFAVSGAPAIGPAPTSLQGERFRVNGAPATLLR